MKPVLFYIDDEPQNLTVFEAALPDDWDVHVFETPMEALEALEEYSPWVIVSDQRMPSMKGVQFLELAKKLKPNPVRIIVTGYSDEDLVVESVRKAQIFDYIRKPWDPDDLEASLQRALDFYKASEEARTLQEELKKREEELRHQNSYLKNLTLELENAKMKESEMRAELECWVPPFVRWAIQERGVEFPIKKDIVGITFDIIGSSQIHDVMVNGRPLRSMIIQVFSEAIIRHGGWRESHSGDSAYGHFGLLDENEKPMDAALAVAREFRVALNSIAEVNGVDVQCGISLHTAKNCSVDIHTVQLNTPRGVITQKSFDTTSADVDLLHRMEKLVHALPGSNVVMSAEFVSGLENKPSKLLNIGLFNLPGQSKPIELFILPSDRVTGDDIERLKAMHGVNVKSGAA